MRCLRPVDEIVEALRRYTSSVVAAHEIEEQLLAGDSPEDILSAVATCAARHVSPGTDPWSGFTDHSLLALEAARFLAGRAPERMPQHVSKVVGTVVAGMLRAPFEWAPPGSCPVPSIRGLEQAVHDDNVAAADAQVCALAARNMADKAWDALQTLGAEDLGLAGHRAIAAAHVPAFARTAWNAPSLDLLRALARSLAGGDSDRVVSVRAHELVDQLPLEEMRSPSPQELDALATSLGGGGGAEAAGRALASGVPPNAVAGAALLASSRRYVGRPVGRGFREVAGLHVSTGCQALWELCRAARDVPHAAFAALQAAEWLRSGFGGAEASTGAEPDPLPEGSGRLDEISAALRKGDAAGAPGMVMAYRESGGSPEGLLSQLAEAAAGPGGAGVHGVKHLHAMWKAFETLEGPQRWVHLAAAARFAAWTARSG